MSGRGAAARAKDQQTFVTRVLLDRLEAWPSRLELIYLLSREVGLEKVELAGLIGVSVDVIARWDGKEDPPAAERLDDLGDIVVQLIRSAGLPLDSVAGWLRSRNRALDWQRPLDVLRLDGYLAIAEIPLPLGIMMDKRVGFELLKHG